MTRPADQLAELQALSAQLGELSALSLTISERVETILLGGCADSSVLEGAVREQAEALARVQRALDVILARGLSQVGGADNPSGSPG